MNIVQDDLKSAFTALNAPDIYDKYKDNQSDSGTAEPIDYIFRATPGGILEEFYQDSESLRRFHLYPEAQVQMPVRVGVVIEGEPSPVIKLWDSSKVKGQWYQIDDKIHYVNNSSTGTENSFKDILSRLIHVIFQAGKNEIFEDGMESNFSNAIQNFIKNFQEDAIEILSDFIDSEQIDSDLLCETLRALGRLDNEETAYTIFKIIIQQLFHPSAFIRDCAGIALYDLESPSAIPYLRKAIDREPYESLKMDFKRIIDELGEIKGA